MEYLYFCLCAALSLILAGCSTDSSEESLSSAYERFFGEDDLEEDLFEEEPLVVELHPIKEQTKEN